MSEVKNDIIDRKIKEVTSKKAHIERMMERGNKSIVLEYGSHTIKYGLASQEEPLQARMLIARKICSSSKASSHKSISFHPPLQQKQIQKEICSLGKISEEKLRKFGNIKPAPSQKTKFGKTSGHAEPSKTKLPLTDKKRPETLTDIVFGEEIFYCEGRSDYIIRQPIKFGLLNVQEDYSEQEAVYDLELITREAMKDLEIESSDFGEFSIMISAPDLFHRG